MPLVDRAAGSRADTGSGLRFDANISPPPAAAFKKFLLLSPMASPLWVSAVCQILCPCPILKAVTAPAPRAAPARAATTPTVAADGP